jgi:hypothetical protein
VDVYTSKESRTFWNILVFSSTFREDEDITIFWNVGIYLSVDTMTSKKLWLFSRITVRLSNLTMNLPRITLRLSNLTVNHWITVRLSNLKSIFSRNTVRISNLKWIFSRITVRLSNLTVNLQPNHCEALKSHNESSAESPWGSQTSQWIFSQITVRLSNLMSYFLINFFEVINVYDVPTAFIFFSEEDGVRSCDSLLS